MQRRLPTQRRGASAFPALVPAPVRPLRDLDGRPQGAASSFYSAPCSVPAPLLLAGSHRLRMPVAAGYRADMPWIP